MVSRLLRTVPLFGLLLVVPATVSARDATPSVAGPMAIVGMKVKSTHGTKVRVHVEKKTIWVRVTGRGHRRVHLVVDGRRSARARQVPFLARISGARLAVGAHRIVVAGQRGPRLSRITFAVVRRAPTIKVVIAPPVKSTSRTARFAWKTAGQVHKASCRLDNGRLKACTSPRRYSGLATGQHRFQLVIKSAAGTTTMARGWVITPSAATTVRFLTQPAATTTRTDANFTWRASGPVSRTVCRLDGGAYRSCTQPHVVRNLAVGAHVFDVQITSRGLRAMARASWNIRTAGTPAPGTPAPPPTPPGVTSSLGAPFAAGSGAGNFQFGMDGCDDTVCPTRKRYLLRWVARHTGVLSTLYLEFKSSPSAPINCPTGQSGYGGGTSGTAQISTYRVRPDGTPDTSQLLARTTLNPCAAASGGSVGVPLGLSTTRGQELATVVQNVDPSPLTNSFSLNGLWYPGGLVGANGRNERSAAATDSYYGLDPRELIGSSSDGGATWRLPAANYVPTYVQVYADGYRDGQPFLYATCPCPGTLSGTQTMVFPRVPVAWTISQLGAYTTAPGSSRVDLLVNDVVVASATLGGTGMLRAAITPVTAPAGSTVKVRTTAGGGGLALQRIDADTAWKYGPVMTLGASWRWQYVEQQGGGASEAAAVTVYPLPMYPTG